MNTAFDRIELHTGAAPWLGRLRTGLLVFAGLNLAASGTEPPLLGISLAALAAAGFATAVTSRTAHGEGRARFGADGVLTLLSGGRERHVTWDGRAWTGARLSVVRWRSEESPQRGHILV